MARLLAEEGAEVLTSDLLPGLANIPGCTNVSHLVCWGGGEAGGLRCDQVGVHIFMQLPILNPTWYIHVHAYASAYACAWPSPLPHASCPTCSCTHTRAPTHLPLHTPLARIYPAPPSRCLCMHVLVSPTARTGGILGVTSLCPAPCPALWMTSWPPGCSAVPW